MKKLIIAAIAITLVILSTAGTYASSGGITWKTSRSGHGYVTRFYDGGKYQCKVYTSRRLKVKVVESSKLTEHRLTGRYNKYILVERIKGKCINNSGDGRTSDGYYISYKRVKGHKAGRKYTTYAIYDNSRYVDDIIGRCDYRR